MSSLYPKIVAALALTAALALPGLAQSARLELKLDHLAAKAKKVVNVTLDPDMLRIGSSMLDQRDRDQAAVKQLIDGLQAVYVRSFEFDKDGQYSREDVENIRKQLRTPGWNCIVRVESKDPDDEQVDVCLRHEAGKVVGMAVLAAEGDELTVVNIVGEIKPEQLGLLRGQFGIPNIERKLQEQNKPGPKNKEE